MADEQARQDSATQHTMLHLVSGEIRNVSDTNPLPVVLKASASLTSGSAYSDGTALPLTVAFQLVSFGFTSNGVIVQNDSDDIDITISWNGTATAAVIKGGESITMQNCSHASIYIKSATAAAAYRIIAW